MNGAEALMRTLVASGVRVCFANPGTSEMQFVRRLDAVPEMRCVLTLFEGVATGAADGYGRVAGTPAVSLVHLGPGLGSGLANLHNARRARTPVVSIVGDHATYHKRFDAPLESDIDAVAGSVSGWLRRPLRPEDVASAAAEAVAAALAPPGQVATLIVPTDMSWSEVGEPVLPQPVPGRRPVAAEVVEDVSRALARGPGCVVLLGGSALRERGLVAAGRLAAGTGARVLYETFPALLEQGGSLPSFPRLAYRGERVLAQLEGCSDLVLVDARPPVSFFAYPGRPSSLVPEGCRIHVLASGADDAVGALEEVSEAAHVARVPLPATPGGPPDRPTGRITMASAAAAVVSVMPEGTIVSDEAITSTFPLSAATGRAARHLMMHVTGGSIGQGLPVVTGAAIARPDRKVLCIEGDGSAMYTIQALWTQARESLDVTTVVLKNGSYAILRDELALVGAGEPGPQALALLELAPPALDYVSLAAGMGVPAARVETAEELTAQLERALAEPGPFLIEAVLPG